MLITELFDTCITHAKKTKAGFNSGGLSWTRSNINQKTPLAITGCYLNLIMEVRLDGGLYVAMASDKPFKKVAEGYNFEDLKQIAEKF